MTRNDLLELYLGAEEQKSDTRLRMDANDFMVGDVSKSEAFKLLVKEYPEIQSVILYRKIMQGQDYVPLADAIDQYLKDNGFVNRKTTNDLIIFFK